MNKLLEEGLIRELACGNNFGYILTEGSHFIMTDYKVLQSQKKGGFISCMKMAYNGKTELFYKVDGYRSFASVLANLNPETFITIVCNMFAEMIEVRNNGFLSCQNIDISWEKIFIDISTLKVKLVYMPVSVKAYEDYPAFENELRTGLIKLINGTSNLVSDKVMQFSEELSNGMLSLEDLYNKMKGNIVPPKFVSAPGTEGHNVWMKLVAMNVPKHFEINIEKDEVVIGKKAELVDAVIPFNKMISRVHCKITRDNGNYYLTDLASANGTYINNVRIAPRQACQVKRGDIIRLANSDFQIV